MDRKRSYSAPIALGDSIRLRMVRLSSTLGLDRSPHRRAGGAYFFLTRAGDGGRAGATRLSSPFQPSRQSARSGTVPAKAMRGNARLAFVLGGRGRLEGSKRPLIVQLAGQTWGLANLRDLQPR